MNILIVAKESKYEWEKIKFGLSHENLLYKYSREHANLDAILKAHEQQLWVRQSVENAMPDATMCLMGDAEAVLKDQSIKYDIVINLGGDNSFTYVGLWLTDTPILGVNSDPERSVGCLTRWAIHDTQSIYDMIEMLEFGEFQVQPWARLHATIDDNPILPASNEYYFGEMEANKMSRHVLVHKGKEYEQKCSGILFSTGAGSTGWYSSIRGKQAAFDPTWNIGAFVVREPYNPVSGGCYAGEIAEGEEIVLYSLNDDGGIVSIDSWKEEKFVRGSEAHIYLGSPLNVIVPDIYHET